MDGDLFYGVCGGVLFAGLLMFAANVVAAVLGAP